MTTFTVLACLAYLVWLILENHLARKHRRAIGHVIHVNGIRGKSSVSRLIDAGLRAGGLRVLTKTTGTCPELIHTNGSQTPLARRGRPSIKEQLRILRLAAGQHAGARGGGGAVQVVHAAVVAGAAGVVDAAAVLRVAAGLIVGDWVVLRHQGYAYNAFNVAASSDLAWTNVTLWAVGGMGIYTDSCTGIAIDGLRITRVDGASTPPSACATLTARG